MVKYQIKKNPLQCKEISHFRQSVQWGDWVLVYITFNMLRTNTPFLNTVNKGLHISILSRHRGVGIYVSGTIEQENKKPHPF